MVGNRIKNQETFNSEYICPSCLLLLRDPVQLIECGHRLCQSCVDEQKSDIVICSKCYEKTLRKVLKLDRGFKNDMQTLSIICSLCDWNGILKNYQDHLSQIHSNPKCIYCEEYLPTVNELDRHQFYVCEKIPVHCPLKPLGCEEIMLRTALNKHYQSKQHQQVLINAALRMKSNHHLTNGSQMITDSPQTMENNTMQLQEIYQTFNILSDAVTILSEDEQRLTTESNDRKCALESVTKKFPTLKLSLQEQNTFIDGIKTNQDILQQDLQLMKEKINDMKTRSYDGTILWKITNVYEKIGEARSDRQTSIYSPPFYSSLTGYKFCLRLYLDGDNTARRTHMSLFIVLMRSEYDAILKYPFDFKVIFCLFDQTKEQNHIIEAFQPDKNSNSFQQPRSDMNIASGIPKFALLKLFQQENNPYIRDDTMFIKAMIDFDDISKNLLSYTFNLNPGLTMPIQQAMIRQENEKRQLSSTSM